MVPFRPPWGGGDAGGPPETDLHATFSAAILSGWGWVSEALRGVAELAATESQPFAAAVFPGVGRGGVAPQPPRCLLATLSVKCQRRAILAVLHHAVAAATELSRASLVRRVADVFMDGPQIKLVKEVVATTRVASALWAARGSLSLPLLRGRGSLLNGGFDVIQHCSVHDAVGLVHARAAADGVGLQRIPHADDAEFRCSFVSRQNPTRAAETGGTAPPLSAQAAAHHSPVGGCSRPTSSPGGTSPAACSGKLSLVQCGPHVLLLSSAHSGNCARRASAWRSGELPDAETSAFPLHPAAVAAIAMQAKLAGTRASPVRVAELAQAALEGQASSLEGLGGGGRSTALGSVKGGDGCTASSLPACWSDSKPYIGAQRSGICVADVEALLAAQEAAPVDFDERYAALVAEFETHALSAVSSYDVDGGGESVRVRVFSHPRDLARAESLTRALRVDSSCAPLLAIVGIGWQAGTSSPLGWAVGVTCSRSRGPERPVPLDAAALESEPVVAAALSTLWRLFRVRSCRLEVPTVTVAGKRAGLASACARFKAEETGSMLKEALRRLTPFSRPGGEDTALRADLCSAARLEADPPGRLGGSDAQAVLDGIVAGILSPACASSLGQMQPPVPTKAGCSAAPRRCSMTSTRRSSCSVLKGHADATSAAAGSVLRGSESAGDAAMRALVAISSVTMVDTDTGALAVFDSIAGELAFAAIQPDSQPKRKLKAPLDTNLPVTLPPASSERLARAAACSEAAAAIEQGSALERAILPLPGHESLCQALRIRRPSRALSLVDPQLGIGGTIDFAGESDDGAKLVLVRVVAVEDADAPRDTLPHWQYLKSLEALASRATGMRPSAIDAKLLLVAGSVQLDAGEGLPVRFVASQFEVVDKTADSLVYNKARSLTSLVVARQGVAGLGDIARQAAASVARGTARAVLSEACADAAQRAGVASLAVAGARDLLRACAALPTAAPAQRAGLLRVCVRESLLSGARAAAAELMATASSDEEAAAWNGLHSALPRHLPLHQECWWAGNVDMALAVGRLSFSREQCCVVLGAWHALRESQTAFEAVARFARLARLLRASAGRPGIELASRIRDSLGPASLENLGRWASAAAWPEPLQRQFHEGRVPRDMVDALRAVAGHPCDPLRDAFCLASRDRAQHSASQQGSGRGGWDAQTVAAGLILTLEALESGKQLAEGGAARPVEAVCLVPLKGRPSRDLAEVDLVARACSVCGCPCRCSHLCAAYFMARAAGASVAEAACDPVLEWQWERLAAFVARSGESNARGVSSAASCGGEHPLLPSAEDRPGPPPPRRAASELLGRKGSGNAAAAEAEPGRGQLLKGCARVVRPQPSRQPKRSRSAERRAGASAAADVSEPSLDTARAARETSPPSDAQREPLAITRAERRGSTHSPGDSRAKRTRRC